MSGKTSTAIVIVGIAVASAVALLLASEIKAEVRSLPDRVTESASSSVIVAASENPRQADAFVDSIGVNVHLHDDDTNYNQQYEIFRSLLISSGIRHIRDGLIDTTWQGYYQRLDELARSGIHADLITAITQSPQLLESYGSRLQPGTIEAIEAPNEYNTSGDGAWASKLTAFQKLLYFAVRASGASNRVRIVGPSLTTASAYRTLGNLSAYLDYGNSHPYQAGREPGTLGWGFIDGFGNYGSLAWNLGIARQVSGPKPIYATEAGYGDAPTAPEGVSAAVKARYVLRLFLEAWNAGVARTYLYQFLDAGNDHFETYGLVDAAMRPKPAYVALKNLIAKLKDPAPVFPLSPLHYELVGPSRLHHTLLERHDGSYALLLWLAIPSWDTGTHQAILTSPRAATITFRGALRISTSTFEDSGATAVHVLGLKRNVTLPISDNVTIVEIGSSKKAKLSFQKARGYVQ